MHQVNMYVCEDVSWLQNMFFFEFSDSRLMDDDLNDFTWKSDSSLFVLWSQQENKWSSNQTCFGFV